MNLASKLKRGMKIIFKNYPYEVIDLHHHKPGKGASVIRSKIKNLIKGNVLYVTFRANDKLEEPNFLEKFIQYIYNNQEIYHFIDLNSFEEIEINKEIIKEKNKFLFHGLRVQLTTLNDSVISIKLPNQIIAKVLKCENVIKGDTVTQGSKPVLFETGLTCNVPLFINIGDNIKIDTRNGEYIERVK